MPLQHFSRDGCNFIDALGVTKSKHTPNQADGTHRVHHTWKPRTTPRKRDRPDQIRTTDSHQLRMFVLILASFRPFVPFVLAGGKRVISTLGQMLAKVPKDAVILKLLPSHVADQPQAEDRLLCGVIVPLCVAPVAEVMAYSASHLPGQRVHVPDTYIAHTCCSLTFT